MPTFIDIGFMRRVAATPSGTCAALIAAAIGFVSWEARADEPPSAPSTEARVRWHEEWPRFRVAEYVYTIGALAAGFTMRFVAPSPDANWRGGILLDDTIVNRMGLENPDNRKIGETVTDFAWIGSMAYRAVDSIAVPLIGYGDGDLTLQMSMIDLEAFGTVAITLWATQLFIGRERPRTRECNEGRFPPESAICQTSAAEKNRSFYGGHPAVATAAAGVTCMHHGHIPLYGGAGDTLACGLTIGAAVMTGIGRIWAEDHYPSDVVVGWTVGAFSGFILPAALHYGFGRKPTALRRVETAAPSGSRLYLVPIPMVGDGRMGAALAGIF
jgi:hypothetical protein